MHFVAAAIAALAVITSAHVTCNPAIAAPNSYFVTVVRVPHSFPGATTVNVSVSIPAGVSSVKPKQVGGWKIDETFTTVNGTSTVSQVTWYGGNLPDELYQDFGLNMKLPDVPVNTVLYFPVVQVTTPNGTLAWNSTPDTAGKLADAGHPAPKVTIVNASTLAAAGGATASTPTPTTAAPGASKPSHAVMAAVSTTAAVAATLSALFL
ncbi:Aste57867_11068 [Aphanomyces stellatus]|uniref:Aste57867_11068 protein n=1 Tax=Aphanomyces stellatus TaxID=120398 RepID=A0A485KTT8_9STRA|nr:hypothetical protein As57867_011026 [Aphanomyces stellatus]VFT87936.1 Aste57867_11068 [Aphanomyces stellatus]